MSYDGTLIAISHDRHFLNSVTTHTADIDYQTIITYTGGYDDMVMAKTQIRSRLESQNEQREKKIAQLNEFIARFAAGTRSSQVTSRRKEVERLQTNELARSNIQRPFIKFDQVRPSGKHVLEFKNLTKFYGDLKVIDGFTANLLRGEKICLMGRNGAWKSTLLVESLWQLIPGSPTRTSRSTQALSSGDTRRKWAIFRRTWARQSSTASPSLSGYIDGIRRRTWKTFAASSARCFFRRRGRQAHQGSVGRRAGAALALHQAHPRKPNILIFDEPTAYLDLEAINALNIALQRYEGTVLLVTHDHDLIDEVATRLWVFNETGIEDFQGPYEEWKGKHN